VSGFDLEGISARLATLIKDHYGLEPTRIDTYLAGTVVLVLMRDSDLLPLERTLIDTAGPQRVAAMRHDFQRMMARRYRHAIEQMTGRRVLTSMSQSHVEPQLNLMAEIFLLGEPITAEPALQ
jgi:uncharacterized protein YbcI